MSNISEIHSTLHVSEKKVLNDIQGVSSKMSELVCVQSDPNTLYIIKVHKWATNQ